MGTKGKQATLVLEKCIGSVYLLVVSQSSLAKLLLLKLCLCKFSDIETMAFFAMQIRDISNYPLIFCISGCQMLPEYKIIPKQRLHHSQYFPGLLKCTEHHTMLY